MITRDTGVIPISIGTANALLALDVMTSPDKRDNAKVESLQVLLINIPTIVRNCISSINDGKDTATPTDIFDAVLHDIETMMSYIHTVTPRLKTILYVQDRKQLTYLLRGMEIKEPTTTKQLQEAKLLSMVLTALHRELTGEAVKGVLPRATLQYNTRFGEYQEVADFPIIGAARVGIITHEAHQLLWESRFSNFYLLESHTGSVKGRTDFYSKLSTLKKEMLLPFNTVTLKTFGDNSTVKPLGIKARREFLALAKENRWNILTSADRMLSSIKSKGSEELRSWFK